MNEDPIPTPAPQPQSYAPTVPAHVPQQIIFKLEGGLVVPSWLAGLLALIVLCSVLSLLVTVLVAGPRLAELGRETRVLGLGVGDVENVLIRAGLAHRDDFAHPNNKDLEEEEPAHARHSER